MARFHHLPIFVVPNVSLKLFKCPLLGGVAETLIFPPPAAADVVDVVEWATPGPVVDAI